MKLQNRTILITGGSSGIGLALAARLLARGNTVIVTGRDPVKLRQAQQALPGLHACQSDVSDAGAIAALFDDVVARFPTLDMLINNAGIMRNLDLHEARGLDDVTREIDINLSGPVRMVQQFLPHLRKQNHAAIVNVSSGLAFIPYPLSPVYCAAKAALHSFTLSLRVQLAGSGVAVVELAPPAVETPLLRGEFAAEMQGQTAMDVNKLADAAIAGIAAGKREIRPGLSNVLYIMSRLAPRFMLNQIVKMSRPKTAA